MLRHLKMKRQQDDAQQQLACVQVPAQQPKQQQASQPVPRRVRGRRSSKPMMEKRRRARINQCLDTLKSYVLTDPSSLVKLGIDTSASENQDEETIARTILKFSGLINRHRGRKNPNKLEKADILELTVDYVRQLHEQRDHWISVANQLKASASSQQQQAALATPLTLNLPASSAHQTIPPSPPPSSASSSPQPLLSISSNIQHLCPDVLDLSGKRTNSQLSPVQQMPRSIYKDGMIFLETPDGSWRPSGAQPLAT